MKFKKELIKTIIFSVVASALIIVHGIFLDLDFSQIKRLTISGFLVTFILVFVGLVILEKIFTYEENEEISKIKKRLGKIEKHH